MPGPKPPVVPLSDEERHTLHTMIRAHKTPQHLSFRAHVILLLAEGLTAPEVARRLGTTRATVSAEQWCQIMALACEPPADSQRPISHWTPRELADEARKRGLVPTISERHVGRFLKSGRPQTAPESLLAESRPGGGRRCENGRGDHPVPASADLARHRGAGDVHR